MRDPVDAGRARAFLAALGREADVEVRAYLTGGATAVMLGWRASTADVDLVWAFIERKLVDPARARSLFAEIEPALYRFPAIDPTTLRRRVDEVFPPDGAPPP